MRPALMVLCLLAMPALAPVSLAQTSLAAGQPAQTAALRLLMVESRGCSFCARWNAEVAPGYAATPQGRAAPLMRVDIGGPWPDGLALASRPVGTPTFILLSGGQEVARFTGYHDAREFNRLLAEAIAGAGGRNHNREGRG
ncbi:MAG: thioredoxin family protein [Paracoccus sp. (in: a-proteobacteria)]|nr:thioredoxin family protein [Paracoccus sp. (in: a-proteobacteria)]